MLNALGLFEKDGQILVSSVDVAENFEKRHKNVIQSIENLRKSDKGFTGLNFQPSARAAERGLKIEPLPYCYHDIQLCILNGHGLKFQPTFGGEEGGARLC